MRSKYSKYFFYKKSKKSKKGKKSKRNKTNKYKKNLGKTRKNKLLKGGTLMNPFNNVVDNTLNNVTNFFNELRGVDHVHGFDAIQK